MPFTFLTLLETFGDYFIAGVLVIFPKNLYYNITAFQTKCMMYFTHYFCRLEILPSCHSQLRMITYICMHLEVVLAKTDSENMLLKILLTPHSCLKTPFQQTQTKIIIKLLIKICNKLKYLDDRLNELETNFQTFTWLTVILQS